MIQQHINAPVPLILVCISLAGLLLLMRAGSPRDSFDVKAQREWILGAVQELARAGPPPADHEQGPQGWWSTPGYLRFSNGWAAYRIHTIHHSSRIGDVSVLRTSEGAYYMTDMHFCTGVTEMMFPLVTGEGADPRSADATDFLEHRGKLQGWNLFAADNHLWFMITRRASLVSVMVRSHSGFGSPAVKAQTEPHASSAIMLPTARMFHGRLTGFPMTD